VEIQALYDQFRSLSTASQEDGGGIDKSTFEQCLGPLGLEKNLITERIFAFFDQDNDGVIAFGELVCGLSVLCKGTLDEKIKCNYPNAATTDARAADAFKGYDLDNDGFIGKEELRKMFKAYFYLSMELVRDVVRALEEEMMESFDEEVSKPVSAAFTAPIPSNRDDASSSSSSAVQKSVPASNGAGDPAQYFPVMETVSQDAIDEMVEKTFATLVPDGQGLISFESFKAFVENDSTMLAWFEALGKRIQFHSVLNHAF
jgi:Ca2+-binding EF-hand superfamily protein